MGYFSIFLKRRDKNLDGIMWLGAGVMKKSFSDYRMKKRGVEKF